MKRMVWVVVGVLALGVAWADGGEEADLAVLQVKLDAALTAEYEALVRSLGSRQFKTRQGAQAALEADLDTAGPFLERAATSEDLEIRQRAAVLLERFRQLPALGPLLSKARKTAGEVAVDAATVKSALAGEAAAAAALEKLGWRVAPAVADAARSAAVATRLRARKLLRSLLAPLAVPPGRKVVLASRADRAYGKSAYSFRYETAELAKHGNRVDLVFNGCGTLHINVHGGMQSRAADLGKGELGSVKKLPDGATWLTSCVRPVVGHLYVQEVVYNAGGGGALRFGVQFRVTRVTAAEVELRWLPVGKRRDVPRLPMGTNGTMGRCGGAHGQR